MRFLKVFALVFGAVGVCLAAAYGSGLFDNVPTGYPRAVWPALGSYETVPGQSRPLQQALSPASLNQRGLELFETSESRALLVWRDGRLVLEHYADGFGPYSKLNSYSLVKSLVGALVLKAVSEGRIDSLDDPIGKYLQDLESDAFRNRPVLSFLEMRSGLDFERDGAEKQDRFATYNPFGNLARLHAGGLPAVGDSLDVLPEEEEKFVYQNVNTAILGHLLEKLYGQPLNRLLAERIWLPAGAAEANWLRHSNADAVTAYCCLYATPRDWIKAGRFLMENGSPQKPFLRQDLWHKFFGDGLARQALVKGTYGLHVRHNILDREGEALQGPFTYMLGQGGQIVYMMPDKDLVVVRFGERHSLLHSTLYSVWNSLPDE